MTIDQHIKELRAELRNAVYRDERHLQISLDLAALAEREVIWARAPRCYAGRTERPQRHAT